MSNDAYNNLTNRQRVYVDAIREHADDLGIDTTKTVYSRAELRQVSMKTKGKIWIPNWITHDQSRRAGRGVFSIPEVMEAMGATMVTPGEGHDQDQEMDALTLVEGEPTPEVELAGV